MKPEHTVPAVGLHDRKLVIFDVDGTLYDQSRLRHAMAVRLLSHVALTGNISTLRALKAYRHTREIAADAEQPDFENEAIAAAARAGKMREDQAREIVVEWMHRRPLPLLARCRYAGVAELFADLRKRGTLIGILSDHPAEAKIAAMGLEADVIAFAGADGVPLQKPDPGGLQYLMEKSDASPKETVLIGDRQDRDGEAGRRAGIDVLIRSDKRTGPDTFQSFASFLELWDKSE